MHVSNEKVDNNMILVFVTVTQVAYRHTNIYLIIEARLSLVSQLMQK